LDLFNYPGVDSVPAEVFGDIKLYLRIEIRDYNGN
jgi:hypothetical protein